MLFNTSFDSKQECLLKAQNLQSLIDCESTKQVKSLVDLSASFFWRLFQRMLAKRINIPNLNEFDCFNETEEFQLVVLLIERLLDLNLSLNAASLHLRQPKKLLFLIETVSILATNLNLSATEQTIESQNDIKERRNHKRLLVNNDDLVDSKQANNCEQNEEEEEEEQLQLLSSSFSACSCFDSLENLHLLDDKKIQLDKGHQANDGPVCRNDFSTANDTNQQLKKAEKEKTASNETREDLMRDLIQIRETSLAVQLSCKIMDICNLNQKIADLEKNISTLNRADERHTKRWKASKSKRSAKNRLDRSTKKVPTRSSASTVRTKTKTTTKTTTKTNLIWCGKLNGDDKSSNQVKVNQSIEHRTFHIQRKESDSSDRLANQSQIDALLAGVINKKQIELQLDSIEKQPEPEMQQLLRQLSELSVRNVKKLSNEKETIQRLQESLLKRQTETEIKLRQKLENEKQSELLRLKLTLSDKKHERLRNQELERKRKSLEQRKSVRDLRTERALLQKRLDEVHRQQLARYKQMEAQQECWLKQQLRQKLHEYKQEYLDTQRQLRDRTHEQTIRQERLWQNCRTLFNSQQEAIEERLENERFKFKQSHFDVQSNLTRMKRQQFKNNLDQLNIR